MIFKVNEIGLFQTGKKDIVKFNDDINFISGDSNTGKSSVGEIIDYCFASSSLPIPKGKIVNEVDLYCINLTLNNYNLLIARQRYNSPNKLKGKNYIFIEQLKNPFSLNSIDIDYFNSKANNYITIDDFKEIEIIKYFPNFPPKTRLDGKEMVRPTIRNMIPFIFQTQDIIKNKTQLFYQFNKSTKVRGIKRDFELFLGLIKPEVYNQINRKNELIKEIKKIENRFNFLDEEIKIEYKHLKSHYYRLFSHLEHNINIDNIELKQLKDINYLNQFDIVYNAKGNAFENYNKLKNILNDKSREIESLKQEHKNIKIQLQNLDTAKTQLNKFISKNDYPTICPLCNSKQNNSFDIFIEAKQKIKEDQNFFSNYNSDILREKEQELSNNLKTKLEDFNIQYKELKILQKDIDTIKDMESKKELLSEIKGMIKQTISKINDYEKQQDKNNNLDNLKSELEDIENNLKNIDIKKKRQTAEYLIGKYSTNLLEKLPFDSKSYGKPNLQFDIKDVMAYQQGEKEIYKLHEIGSAENHLSFHLSVFFGLHKYILENQSSILPSFIFLDQPSQVYFPTEKDFKEGKGDIKEVEKIYKKLINEINDYNSSSNMFSKIQIIIVDHFYSQDNWYQKYLVEPRWEKEKGLGLIKNNHKIQRSLNV